MTIRPPLLCVLILTALPSPLAQTTISFQPSSLSLAQGESALVTVEVSGLPAGGLSGFQLRIDVDNAVASLEDPNAAFVPSVLPFAALGGDPLCDSVRGEPCADPVWLPVSTGRTAVQALAETAPAGDYVRFAFGTRGTQALPESDGALAIVRVVAEADGQATATLTQTLLADAAQIPAAIPVSVSPLTITVGGAPDSDGDGVPDDADNCIDVANPAQTDTDGDNFGNACDPDYNNDGIVNVIDLGLLKQAFFGNDPNIDLNDDGIVNVIDLGIFKSYFFQPPGPSGTASRPAPAEPAIASSSFVNTPPVADVPERIESRDGRAFFVDASASHVDDLDRLAFDWRIVAAPDGVDTDWSSTEPRAGLTLPAAGDYAMELTVTDGTDVSRRRVRVTLLGDEARAAPALRASGASGARTYTSGRRSGAMIESDPDAGEAHFWSLVAAPADSALTTLDLDGRAGPHVRFLPDRPGQYLLRVDSASGEEQRFEQVLIVVPADD